LVLLPYSRAAFAPCVCRILGNFEKAAVSNEKIFEKNEIIFKFPLCNREKMGYNKEE